MKTKDIQITISQDEKDIKTSFSIPVNDDGMIYLGDNLCIPENIFVDALNNWVKKAIILLKDR